MLLEGAGLLSGGVCLVGAPGRGQGIAKHGEGPRLGGMGAQLLPEAGRLGEVRNPGPWTCDGHRSVAAASSASASSSRPWSLWSRAEASCAGR
jgi:hypothetical protein